MYLITFQSPIECDSGERIFDTQGSDIEFKDDGGEMLTVGGTIQYNHIYNIGDSCMP